MNKILLRIVLLLITTSTIAQSNPNNWVRETTEDEKKEFSFVPLILSKLEREVKLNPNFYDAGFNMLAVVDENTGYDDNVRFKNNLVSFSTIKPNDTFVKLKYAYSFTLIKNVKSNQLYIIANQYINYQSSVFKPETSVIKYKQVATASLSLTPQELALLGKYKKVLTNGSVCTQTISSISNKKQYAFRNGFDPRKVTSTDKIAYNNAIKRLWSLDKEWKTIREDETLLNGNNKLMEKLMDEEKYMNIKLRMETLSSTPLL